MRHSGRSRPAGAAGREAAAVHVAHAAALMVSASRQSWRVPLISSVIATRLLGLLGGLAEPTAPGARGIRRGAALALWLAALLGLRAQAARAEAWDAPLVR
jgi:hypothetical protein